MSKFGFASYCTAVDASEVPAHVRRRRKISHEMSTLGSKIEAHYQNRSHRGSDQASIYEVIFRQKKCSCDSVRFQVVPSRKLLTTRPLNDAPGLDMGRLNLTQ